MVQFEIHHRLLGDCHRLGRLQLCHLLLHKNAVVPWFILVPELDLPGDLFDLPEPVRRLAIAEAGTAARFIRNELDCDKINFAAIGNIVPQLHLHVVGRRPDDSCWPAPVWGNLVDTRDYTPARVRAITDVLAQKYSLKSF
jgi:diadenosine tetraphosphate (Ap4A) HIT family hydrolase